MDPASLATLDRQRYLNLATFRRNGRAVETPVWFALREGRLYVFTDGTSGKVKRLRANPRIRIAPCDVRGKLKGDWGEGEGRIIDEPAAVEAAYAVLRRKYGLQMRVTDFFSRLAGRISRRAILELEL
jgi:PPOX class probable F420-dependent enzyme